MRECVCVCVREREGGGAWENNIGEQHSAEGGMCIIGIIKWYRFRKDRKDHDKVRDQRRFLEEEEEELKCIYSTAALQ